MLFTVPESLIMRDTGIELSSDGQSDQTRYVDCDFNFNSKFEATLLCVFIHFSIICLRCYFSHCTNINKSILRIQIMIGG